VDRQHATVRLSLAGPAALRLGRVAGEEKNFAVRLRYALTPRHAGAIANYITQCGERRRSIMTLPSMASEGADYLATLRETHDFHNPAALPELMHMLGVDPALASCLPDHCGYVTAAIDLQ
jgi:hypothetical protein